MLTKTAERLLRYVQVDTQSDPSNEQQTPSAQKEFDLARMLEKELRALGLENVELDEHGYVYAWLPAHGAAQVPTVGFVAHMDTAPAFSGKHVRPRVIEHYDGGDIRLNDHVTTRVAQFPQMKALSGKTLIVTDGTTLLGADDKAGVAAIVEAMRELQENKHFPHGRVAVVFTPDEEVGSGTRFFDIEKCGADFAYTMDGGEISELSDETFCAASAKVHFAGFSIHPGSAKNKMINAAAAACFFQNLLPQAVTPEHTEGREGFLHLEEMQGQVDEATLSYIVRDHDPALLEQKKQLLRDTAAFLNARYGTEVARVTFEDGYTNMKAAVDAHPEVMRIALQSLQDLGLTPHIEPIRGGTDGAELSRRGLPCPNLGNGGGNFHGPYEYCVVEELEQCKDLILKIIENTAKYGQ